MNAPSGSWLLAITINQMLASNTAIILYTSFVFRHFYHFFFFAMLTMLTFFFVEFIEIALIPCIVVFLPL